MSIDQSKHLFGIKIEFSHFVCIFLRKVDQRTLSKKSLTKCLMENFDRVNEHVPEIWYTMPNNDKQHINQSILDCCSFSLTNHLSVFEDRKLRTLVTVG
jgi:hypothetical protein